MIEDPRQEGTPEVKRSGSRARVKVSADGKGVVSHAGAALLRELAAETGLAGAVTGVLMDTYRGFPLHMPGQVFTDLAVAIADGADAVTGIEVLRDREALFAPVASMPTAWRLLDRIDAVHLDRVRAAGAASFGENCSERCPRSYRPGRIGQEDSGSDEVARVVELVTQHAHTRPGESLGVIAMGIKHANRIDEALRRERANDPVLDDFLNGTSQPKEERFFVKNLERVQGDERDAIILTIGYGKTADGRMLYRFGPLNNDGGERRLNVAITRARARMTVVSSFSAADMDPTKLRAEGAKMLHGYLAYAESGGTNLGNAARTKSELNPFERDVETRLRTAGIPLIAQYGCSGYWIDFAAQHPTKPGQMVLAIECDGATYHSSNTARDRDRLRQEHLERLGWTFHRIWSQDWFFHREREIQRTLDAYRPAVTAATNGARLPQLTAPPQPVGTGASAPKRNGPCPIWIHGLGIDEYSNAQLDALIRWIESDTLLRTEEQLFAELMRELGFSRRGSKVTAALNNAIRRTRRSAR